MNSLQPDTDSQGPWISYASNAGRRHISCPAGQSLHAGGLCSTMLGSLYCSVQCLLRGFT